MCLRGGVYGSRAGFGYMGWCWTIETIISACGLEIWRIVWWCVEERVVVVWGVYLGSISVDLGSISGRDRARLYRDRFVIAWLVNGE